MTKRSESLITYWRSKRASKRRVKTTWKERHPERTKELKRLSYARHKETINARARERRQNDPVYREKYLARGRLAYQRHHKEIRAKENARRAGDPQFYRERARRWRAEHRAACLLADIKKRSKKSGLDCDLTVEWIQQRLDAGVCELSGLPFDLQAKHLAVDGGNAPSIDRIDPSGPYVTENCRMILWCLNRAFSNYGENYILDVFEHVLRRKGRCG